MPQPNKQTPARHIAVLSQPGEHFFGYKHPKSYRIIHTLSEYQPKIQNSTLHPSGGTHHSVLFELGHPRQSFESSSQLTPRMLRELRQVVYSARKNSGTIHLFGVLDTESPHGSYRLLESIVRFLIPSLTPLTIHAGLWSPTPREFKHAYNELRSLTKRDAVKLGSIFPLHILKSKTQTASYIDDLHKADAEPRPLTFPLTQPVIFRTSVMPEDVLLVPLSPSHELFNLDESLQEHFPFHERITLTHDYPSDPALQKTLDKSKHVFVLANRPSYVDAYFGSEIRHPYFETIFVHSPNILLEMLISPHFGYATPPYRTVVFIDEARGDEFDWLLASYIRKIMTEPFLFQIIRPDHLQSVNTYSNSLSSKLTVNYEDLYWYGQ